MIASLGDVSEERGIVREVLYDWIDVNEALRIVKLLVNFAFAIAVLEGVYDNK